MSATIPNRETTSDDAPPAPGFRQMALLLAVGWALTNIAYAIYDLPLKFVLKDELHLDAQKISMFFALGVFSNYVKPLAGILTDSVPLFGTRRRHYLLLSGVAAGGLWLLIGLVPRTYAALLAAVIAINAMLVVGSTAVGGVRVHIGPRDRPTGRA